MHLFPKDEEVRWKWIKFVQQRRADFVGKAVNSAHNSLCSARFEESCFTRKPADQLEIIKLKRTLIQGSVPTIDLLPPNPDRQERQVSDEYALSQSRRNWSDFCLFQGKTRIKALQIFFLINWQASTLEGFRSICCRLDLRINIILLLNRTSCVLSRIMAHVTTWNPGWNSNHWMFTWCNLKNAATGLYKIFYLKYGMDLRINFGFKSELWQEIWRTWQHETQITGCLHGPF